jgi:hypothetical protein
MRPRVVAASTATLIAAASLAPVAAQAAGEKTIFVNGSSSVCTDSGAGTLAAPYCTIQAAADAADPGDVVNVAAGTYAATTITRSGTPSAPIIFTGNGVWSPYGLTGMSGYATAPISISGASFVRVENFAIQPGSSADVTIDGGSDITLFHDYLRDATATGPAVHITDAASDVTVEDSVLDEGILVDGGSTGSVLSTNWFDAGYTNPISVVGAANTAITSNTFEGCGPAVSVTGSAADTSIENNVIASPDTSGTGNCPASSQPYGILVDSSSASGTTEDYNDVYATGTGAAPYDWAGTAYATAAGLNTATGQAQHDDNSLLGTERVEHSPLINSANSAAIGEQATDMIGNPRTLDPLVTPIGAGPDNDYDRGAVQFQDPMTLLSSSFTASTPQAPVDGSVTLHATVTDTWSDTFDYKFEPSNGTVVDGGTSGTATVAFGSTGETDVELLLTPANGTPVIPTRSFGYVQIDVVPQAPLVPQISASADGAYGVSVADTGTTDAWPVSSVTYNFGDNSPTQTVEGNGTAPVQHTYAKAGTYTITETVADVGGNTAATFTRFSTAALVPGTLINLGVNQADTPAGSTGIAQTAVASMPNGSSQLLTATTAGTVEFATGTADGDTWQSWQKLSLPAGVTAQWVGIAGMPNGSSQLIVVTSTGQLWHTVRNANGTFQVSGWGSPAGSTGFTHATVTAMPDGSSQFVAVTTSGVLMHNIRFANGSWQGWRPLSQPGVKVVDASIAGMPDGSSQIVEVTSAGVLKHDIRFANGSWQAFGWASPAGGTGITQVSITATPSTNSPYGPGSTFISAVTSQGALETISREPNGAWTSWVSWPGNPDPASPLGNLGTAVNTTISSLPDGTTLLFAVTGG